MRSQILLLSVLLLASAPAPVPAQPQTPATATNALIQPPWIIERVWKGMRECEKRALAAIADPHWEKPADMDDEGWKYLLTVRAMMLADNQPVEFYAKALDQAGQAVSGATLSLELSRTDETLLATTNTFSALKMGNEKQRKPIVLTSDADGWFRLKDVTGKYLHLKGLEKEGYLWTRPALTSFSYELCREPLLRGKLLDFLDPQTGYTFHLWRKGLTEPLVPFTASFDLRPDQVTNRFSLFANKPLSAESLGEDLQISIPLTGAEETQSRFERRIRLSVPSGGIVETADFYAYSAPSTGYTNHWEWLYQPLAQGPSSKGWTKRFYVKCRNAKVTAGLKVTFEPGTRMIEIEGMVNPSGSRVLEPDPTKLITDPAEIRRLDEATRSK